MMRRVTIQTGRAIGKSFQRNQFMFCTTKTSGIINTPLTAQVQEATQKIVTEVKDGGPTNAVSKEPEVAQVAAPVEELKPEDFYKAMTQQEIKSGPFIEHQEMIKPDKQSVPEKDHAFVEKKLNWKQQLKVIWEHMKHSLIDVWKDTKILYAILKKNGIQEVNYSMVELKEKRRITMDLFKFMPYTVFLVVPGAELLMPPYVLLFPNSTPSEFLTSAQKGDIRRELDNTQLQGYNNFVRSIPKFGKLLDIDPIHLYESLSNLQNTEGREKDRQLFNASDFESKINSFLAKQNKDQLISRIGLNTLNSQELENLFKMFSRKFVPSYNWVNLAYSIPFRFPCWLLKFIAKQLKDKNAARFTNNIFYKFSFTLDNGPLSVLKKYLILMQLRHHIKHIRAQDRALARNLKELEELDQLHLVEYTNERAIQLEDRDEILNYVKKYWLPLSTRKDISDDLLVWITVLRFQYADIMI
jgi:LETM1 and EF-hand domain-containing protein 1, mitochondrial